MGTVGMAGNVAFGTPTGILATKREHISTMTTPVGTDIRDRFEAMGNTVVDFLCIVVLKHSTSAVYGGVNSVTYP